MRPGTGEVKVRPRREKLAHGPLTFCAAFATMLSMATSGSLRNVGSRPFYATLHHSLYCERGGTCRCEVVTYDRADRSTEGLVVTSSSARVQPASIGLIPGQSVGGLHPCAQQLPGVENALTQSPPWLAWEDEQEVETPTPSPATAPLVDEHEAP